MRATVKRCFCDKNAGERFVPAGSTYDASPERIAELARLGYVEAPPQEQRAKPKRDRE